MNVILEAIYPSHAIKAAIDAYVSPDMPKRPESAKELASITYMERDGVHAFFVFSVQDADLANFYEVQSQRSFFIAARVEGFTTMVHVGSSVAEAIPKVMPVLPG